MSFPFKIIHGGQAEPTPPVPTKFAQFDQRRIIGDQFIARFLARRDKAIERERAKKANLLSPQSQPKSKKKGH